MRMIAPFVKVDDQHCAIMSVIHVPYGVSVTYFNPEGKLKSQFIPDDEANRIPLAEFDVTFVREC